MNFDGPHSDEVRRFFIENALCWVTEFRVDGLRLDAVHAITDVWAVPFLEELGEAVHRQAEALGRAVWLFPESDANDARLVRPRAAGGGYGLHLQRNDGFHHALRALCSPGKTADITRITAALAMSPRLIATPTSTPASIRGFAAGGTAVLLRGWPAASSSSSRRTTTRSATACWASASPR